MDELNFTQYSTTTLEPTTSADQHLSTSNNAPNTHLWLLLNRLGLGTYYSRLVENGFDSWDTVLDITQEDLKQLSFKRGDMRRLQRAISDYRTENPLKMDKSDNDGASSGANKSRDGVNTCNPKLRGTATNHRRHVRFVEIELREYETEDLKRSSSHASDDTVHDGWHSGQDEQLEHTRDAINMAMKEVSYLLEAKGNDVEIFDGSNLPPYELTILAVTAFLEGPGTLLFLWTKEEVSSTIAAFYTQRSKVGSHILVDLLAMAAVGALCGCNCFTKALTTSYYFSCLKSLSTCAETSNISSSQLIAAALKAGRLELRKPGIPKSSYLKPEKNWSKVFRSAVLIECWLRYAFGLENCLTEEEINAERSVADSSVSIEDHIQEQASRVLCLAADISTKVRNADGINVNLIKDYMGRLNQWYWELPLMMQLATLSGRYSEIFSPFQKRAIFQVHLQSLGVATLLNRPLLVTIAEAEIAGTWTFDDTVEKYKVYQDYCVLATQQASRIAAMLQLDGNMPKHCWMTIFECSNASCILLFDVSQKLFYGFPEGIEIHFTYLQNFIRMLRWCGTADSIPNLILDKINTIYEALNELYQSRFPPKEDNNHHTNETDACQLQTPMECSTFANSRIDNTLPNPSNRGLAKIPDPKLAAILKQIIELALDPSSVAHR